MLVSILICYPLFVPSKLNQKKEGKTMKVGILLDGNPDFPGGVQTYVKGLYQFLRKAGHQAVIIAGGEEGESEKKGFKVARVGKSPTLPGIGTQISAYTDWIGKEEIEKITEKERLEILHLQGMFGVLGMRFLDHTRTPSVATFHNYLEPERLPVSLPLLFPLMDHYIKKLDGRIAISQPALEFANQVSPGEYAVIPPGIDLERFKDASFPCVHDFSSENIYASPFILLVMRCPKLGQHVDRIKACVLRKCPWDDFDRFSESEHSKLLSSR
ncbi:hypothetical protein CO059_01315 [candidate division WWE3 bacterium CG_4_9_14_0_2_um_filter_48_10]|uniref:Glycosyltransferase subfamily 4-like N-terminal domain-containing protein n=1 Tax=candidate division WWE3 bacterium CG_4_9_14_0_2_um_filter_48_10 TaxID=1975078 RepID=A0A2M8EJS9_UNCKA|nr:MAG: hypothetical protein CO059_01315 [candidate division WWE3 bacterium CG_4_9_14_0_2_um_filter_48_10]